MMRKKLFIFLLILLPVIVQAQDERKITPVNWNQIEKVAKEHPDSIKALVARLTRPELDTTLTMSQRVLALYGQTYISRGGEALDVMHMNDSLQAGSFAAIGLADKALARNPLNVEALTGKAAVLFKMLDSNPADSAELQSKARCHACVQHYCLNRARDGCRAVLRYQRRRRV